MIFVVLELLIAVLVIAGTITQVIVPLVNNTPFFPAFKSGTAIEAELELARQKVRIAELENERDQYLKQAEDLRKSSTENQNDSAQS